MILVFYTLLGIIALVLLLLVMIIISKIEVEIQNLDMSNIEKKQNNKKLKVSISLRIGKLHWIKVCLNKKKILKLNNKIKSYEQNNKAEAEKMRKTAKKEAIFKFFEFYYGEEGAQIVANTNMLPTSKFSGTVDAEKNPVFAQIVDLYNEEGWSNQFQPYGYMATNVADTWADSMWGVALGNYTPEEAAEKVEQEIRY